MGRASSGLWIALALAGCAGAEAMSQPTAPTAGSGVVETQSNDIGLSPGETMAFEVRIGGVLAGEAILLSCIGKIDVPR